ncbi:translation initiation factor IF-2-like [Dermacentor silvarum]|uniref:translation initiation factor IF-2-like n=1 Tax=Dermacentor silvarum TaxID=543639 RepID=UPI0021010D6F|nr:translation initiation factor IF-2-like [Dermacentor silvarum]
MAIKPRAVMVRPSSGTTTAAATTFARDTQRPTGLLSLASKPRAVPVCPSAATKTAADTKFAREAPVRPSAARKGVQQPQVGSTSGPSKHARGMPSAPTVAKRPADRPTPALPEPRRPLGPPAGQTGASKRNLRPVGGATSGPARGPAARLSTAAKAPRPLLSGARRSVAAVPRAADSQPVPAQPEAKTGRPAGPALQPSQLPRSRLRPPASRGAVRSVAAVPRAAGSQPVPAQPAAKTALPAAQAVEPSHLPRSRLRPTTSRVSGNIPHVPRPAFSGARRLPPVPESPVPARHSTPEWPNVTLRNYSPQLSPIRKQPGRH